MSGTVAHMRRSTWGVLAVIALAAAWLFWPKKEDRGNARFFADQAYYFETIRVLTDTGPAGGDTGEASRAMSEIVSGDADGWYAAWNAQGDRVSALAATIHDPSSKGDALLRAHTYYRSAEFFLDPKDPRRPAVWKRNVDTFYSGLDSLGVRYERFTAPYGQHHLNAVYYPGPAGAQAKPLIVAVNGYDGTMEELYGALAAAALRRGYAVLTYEGPGQGAVLREQGVTLTPEWEKPNGAVLDAFLATHAKPSKIVLIGASFGGYFAPRAAAFDARIDGVVAYDEFFDGGAIASHSVPKFALWLMANHYDGLVRFLGGLKKSPGSTWAQQNGMWTLGVDGPAAVLEAFKAYSLAPVAGRIRGDVLIMAGADDHFVPVAQVDEFKKSLTGARSVTTVVFDRESGGSEHCQIGAPSLWQATFFDWVAAKFGA
jgi:alpha-beta hydrolase superfamily lysophospholipase